LKIWRKLADLGRHFVSEWRSKPITITLETVGVMSSMLAALMISLQLTSMILVFLVWMLGSVTMACASYLRHNLMWLLLSVFYLIMNVLGLTLLLI
jgi:hypothetical protein